MRFLIVLTSIATCLGLCTISAGWSAVGCQACMRCVCSDHTAEAACCIVICSKWSFRHHSLAQAFGIVDAGPRSLRWSQPRNTELRVVVADAREATALERMLRFIYAFTDDRWKAEVGMRSYGACVCLPSSAAIMACP